MTVTPDSSSVAVGTSQTLKAVARDASGNTLSGVQFFWSSNDAGVASVDQSGVVSTHSVGMAHIAASTQGVSGVAAVSVVSQPITSVVVAPTQATLRVSTTLQLSDTAVNAAGAPVTGQPATWASSNTSVATVDAAGLVIARATGTARISATVAGITGSATITVTLIPIASIAITPPSPNVYVHQTTQLTATPKDSSGNALSGRPVTWKSLASGVATVSASGLVTGVAAGSAVIQATAQGVIGEDAIKVTAAPVSTVVLSPATSQVYVGQTEQLTATVTDATGTPISGAAVTFSSSKPGVATVNASTGVVTGVSAGITTIAGTSGGKSGQAAVAVFQVPVGSVTIQPADTTIAANGTAHLRATVVDSLGRTVSSPAVTWTSIPAGRVSNTGVVTPQPADAGSAITVQGTSGGKAGTAVVHVSAAPVASVTVQPADTTITTSQTAQMRVTVVNTSGQTIASPSVTWSSTPAGRVSGSGLVTPQANDGGASITVTATSGGVSGTATVNVSAPPPPGVASVTVMPADTTITATQTAQMRVTVVNTAGQPVVSPSVTWSSTPGGRVSASGLVTPQPNDAGSAIAVQAMSGGVSGTATVNVSAPSPPAVSSVTVQPSDTTIAANQTAQMRAAVVNTLGQTVASPTVTWSSTPAGRVNGSGVVTPRPPDAGAAIMVTATSGGVSGTTTVNVSAAPPPPPPPAQVASVVVVPGDTTIDIDETAQLQDTVKNTLGQPMRSAVVTWTSNPAGRVSPTGLVTPQPPDRGIAIAVMASSGGQSGSATVTVSHSRGHHGGGDQDSPRLPPVAE